MNKNDELDFYLAITAQIDKIQKNYTQLEEYLVYELQLSEKDIDDLLSLIHLHKLINDLGHAANSMFFKLSKRDQKKAIKLREELLSKNN